MTLRNSICNKLLLVGSILLSSITFSAQAEPLKIGYSDWPGWVAWEVAIEKGMFKEAGVEVEFEWFDYVASMDAFAAGKLDAVTMTMVMLWSLVQQVQAMLRLLLMTIATVTI